MNPSRLEFGLLLHTRHLIREEGPTDFSPLWEEALLADEIGADHIWLGDSVTILDKARGDCLTTMAALAAKTKRVRIGVVPFLAALRNPVSLAHALATLDVISQGRIIIGASVGSVKQDMNEQFDACGVPYNEKAGRLNESIMIMRRLWNERAVTFEGKYYQIREAGILPHPVQKPVIPIWFATGKSEIALRRAGRLGDGWVTNASNLDDFISYRRIVDGYARQYGREGCVKATVLYASLHLDEDGERARREGWSWMEEFFRQPRAKLGQHLAIFGTPDECAQTFRGYVKAGLTAVIARLASEDQRTQINALLNDLKPRLAD
jgi:alkanesulfonate monooxygenase SsuD/methylene tetrahydromethanopterin reductase-like flavin-dependent oxidoreductase (luciferase family)